MDYDNITRPTEYSMVLVLADISGFSKTGRALNGRETFDMLNEFYELVGNVVENAGGKVVKFIGDAAFIVFPAAQAPEAVVALEHLQDLAQTIWAHHDGVCEIRIIAHAGTVTCGPAGTAGNKQFDVFGPPVNELFLMEPHEFGMSSQLQALLSEAPPAPAAAANPSE
jgi:adenylate cyclase